MIGPSWGKSRLGPTHCCRSCRRRKPVSKEWTRQPIDKRHAFCPTGHFRISSIAKRQIHCVLSDVAEGLIAGFGMHSYILGLEAMLEILRTRRQPAQP